MVPVRSLGEAVNQLEEEFFVGRQSELDTFRSWITFEAPFPEVFAVSGPSGVGKSALLRAFKRIAQESGRAVVFVNGGSFDATPHGLLGAMNDSVADDLGSVVARLNDAASLILIDSFEELGGLAEYLQDEFLPRLDTTARVVIAGRYPLSLARSRSEPLQRLIRPIRLTGFSPVESRDYLRRRGLDEPRLVEQVIAAAGDNPLALSLAADLALQFGVRDFATAREWHLVVRWLVERLLAEVSDPRLRDLLEACMAVRQFDEATLAAVSGRDDITAEFEQLCQLSIVSPAEHGLMLHDDVRRLLAEDLAWRRPDRYGTLRTRALAYYRERVRSAPPQERQWLVADRFFLWGNALIQELFFSPDEPGQVWVEPGQPAMHADIRRLFTMKAARVPPELVGDRLSPPAVDGEFLGAVLGYPGTRLRVARDREGRTLGFSTVLPVCQETIPLLDLHPAYRPLVHAHWTRAALAALPPSAERATAFYFLHLVFAEEMSGASRAALNRDLASVFASGGAYLCSTFVPTFKQMLEACGFELVPAARNDAWGKEYPVDGYVLDLSGIGFEPWIEAVMDGRRPPKPLDCADLENELHITLRHWNDDRWLARSRLAELPAIAHLEG